MPQQPNFCNRCGSDKIRGVLAAGTVAYDCASCGHQFSSSIFGIDAKVEQALASAKRKAWRFQFCWFGYFFRNPGLVLVFLCWPVSLLFFFSIHSGRSVFQTISAWIVGTVLASIAPSITILYIRRKRAGPGALHGWKTAVKGSPKPLLVTLGSVAGIFLIKLVA